MNTQEKQGFISKIEQNRGIIIKICNSYCQNVSDREDLAQEIVYHLWKAALHYDARFTFSTWMYRVALNVAISFYRKEKKKTETVTLPGDLESIYTNPETPYGIPEESIVLLQRLISELNALDKALMILYLESKSYAEIADTLGISESNTATKISRIKEKLKKKIIKYSIT